MKESKLNNILFISLLAQDFIHVLVIIMLSGKLIYNNILEIGLGETYKDNSISKWQFAIGEFMPQY